MHLVFDIFQGIGVAAAIGVRPFLPALVAGALAAADVELTFHHTKLHFLQRPLFLFIMLAAIVVVALIERRLGPGGGSRTGERTDPRPLSILLALCSLALGALFFGAELERSHHSVWIGVVGGLVCAAIGVAATHPLLARVRARLDAEAGGVLPVVTDGVAALAAALSIVAPPIGLILVLALVWLLVAGRGRADRKYAGLRILR